MVTTFPVIIPNLPHQEIVKLFHYDFTFADIYIQIRAKFTAKEYDEEKDIWEVKHKLYNYKYKRETLIGVELFRLHVPEGYYRVKLMFKGMEDFDLILATLEEAKELFDQVDNYIFPQT